MEPCLLIDTSNPAITVLTLNRAAKRNALSLELIEAIASAIASANDDRARRVIVLRANGPSFCAGLDLHEASSADGAQRSATALSRMYLLLGNSPLVTVAAAHGAAMGGGAGLLAACDFVIAADDLRLSFPEVRRGLVAALVTCLLRRQMNDRAVRELILLGKDLTAAEAIERKLISRIVPRDELHRASIALAQEACKGAPGAIARSKRLLDDLSARPLEEDLRRALDYHLHARQSDEAAEGMVAFLEKREPRWGIRPQ